MLANKFITWIFLTTDGISPQNNVVVKLLQLYVQHSNEEKEKADHHLNLIVRNVIVSAAGMAQLEGVYMFNIYFSFTAFQEYLWVSTKTDKSIRFRKHSDNSDKTRLLKISVCSGQDGWVIVTDKTKNWNDTNSRVLSGYDVHNYHNG